MSIIDEKRFSRAAFLKGGSALVITLAVPGSLFASTATMVNASDDWPVPDPGQLDTWIAIHSDGTASVFTGKVEIGNGAAGTGLRQIVADELDLPFDAITMIMGDSNRTPDQGPTAGSATVAFGGPPLRQAAADARYTLLQMASSQLGVSADKLIVNNGVVSVESDPTKSVSYASLIGGKSFNETIGSKGAGFGLTVGGKGTPKSPSQYKVVGTSVPRPDIPEKVSAKFTYIHDVKIPGMLHGRVIRPTGIAAKLLSVGTPPKGTQVVRKNNFLGVVAANEWDAINAAQTLKVKWSNWTGLPTTEQVYDAIRNATATDKVVASKGDVTTALAAASKRVSATYQTPFETHGALGPSVAIADVRNGEATIYTGSSGPHSTQTAIAQLLNLPVEKVRVVWHEAAGDYGTNGADPAAADAALMSQAVGKPVRVQWMRWDEHGWDPKGPAMVQDIHAGLDPSGQITGWNHEVWDPPDTDSLLIGSVLAGTPVGVEGRGGWSGPLLYNIANSQQLNHAEVDLGPHTSSAYGIITSFLRSPAQYQITFAMESFMDELAAADKADPVQFRLNYLTDQRMIDLLRATVEKANWDYRPSPSTSANGTAEIAKGRGVAISLRGGTYNAEVAFVEVNRKTGKVSVERFVVGQDNGLTINPRQVEIQIETCVVQTTSRALLEEITFSDKAVTSLNWDTYPILHFLDAPKVETVLIDHPNLPATGVGEPSACPVAAAIANAIYDAVGVRIRTLPLRAKNVKAALDAAAAKA